MTDFSVMIDYLRVRSGKNMKTFRWKKSLPQSPRQRDLNPAFKASSCRISETQYDLGCRNPSHSINLSDQITQRMQK